jgi:hypothetical protein
MNIFVVICVASYANAMEPIVGDQLDKGVQTQQDLPASFHRYYGQRINTWEDGDRKIAKFDIDADLNLDGVVSNTDPADGGAFESTPPGLMVGVGEMSKIIIRLNPYRVDFDGEIVVTLELAGINRSDESGVFGSFKEQVANTGHVRVWADAEKTKLLLDSTDPKKQFIEFTTQFREFPYNLQYSVPRFVYVEGVKAAPRYMGDVRILGTVSHRPVGATRSEVAPSRREDVLKRFRTSFDHILITVLAQPAKKSFVNNNVEAVWISGDGATAE